MLFYKIRCKGTEIFANKQIKSLLLLKFSRIFLIFTKFSAIIYSFWGIIVGLSWTCLTITFPLSPKQEHA